MARTVRDANLGKRESRFKLKAGERHWRGIHEGLALGYRRGKQGSGSWSARLKLSDGRYVLRSVGTADDHAAANGVDVLTFAQAQRKAIELQDDAKHDEGILVRPLTVKEAADHYLTWFKVNKKSLAETRHAINAHILPAFGQRQVATLKAKEIEEWHGQLATRPARTRTSRIGNRPQNYRAAPKTDDQVRARKATANRVLTVFKAILNKAFRSSLVSSDTEWRKVKPFANVDAPRIRFLEDSEAVRLVNACPPDLRKLVRAALLTGARYQELTTMRAQDVSLNLAQVYIRPSKSDRARHVPLNVEGVALFRDLIAGKTGDQLLFQKVDGTAWGKNHHVRPLHAACKAAKVRPAVAFHELRHTYASHLAQASVELLTISKLLGHADTRITAKHYAHLADKTLANAVTKLPDFGYEATQKLKAIR